MRFRFNNDKWAEYPNSVLFSISSKKNHDGKESLVLSASQEKGMIPRNQNGIDIKYSEESVFTYKIIENGDYVIHLRSFQGGFAFSRFNGICSPAYTVLKPNKEILSNGFLENYFTSKKFIDSLRTVTFGIRDGKSISVDQWMTQSLFIPSKNEQEKIIAFIQKINSRIEVQNKIISKYETLIKGITDCLLNKKEDNYYTFKDLYLKAGEGGTPTTENDSYYENGTIPFIKIDDLSQKYIKRNSDYITHLGLEKSAAWLIPTNSVIFSNGATIGRISINTYPIATKQGVLGIVPSTIVMTEYLYYYMKTTYFRRQVRRITVKGTMDCAYLKDLNSIICHIPDINHQEKRIALLTVLDEKIACERMILQKLKEQKKYLLSKMFI